MNLLPEFASAVSGMTAATDDYVTKGLGVPESMLYGGPSYVGVLRADLSDEAFYQPSEDGTSCLAVPVGVQCDEGWDFLVDILAFQPRNPTRWWLRRGCAAILNPEGVRRAEHFREILAVWSSPLAWLKSGGQGIVILDWSAHLPLWLSGVSAIACETPALAGRVQSALREQTITTPDVRVIKSEVVSHAA